MLINLEREEGILVINSIIISCVEKAVEVIIKKRGEQFIQKREKEELIKTLNDTIKSFTEENENEFFNSSSFINFFEAYNPVDIIFNSILGERDELNEGELISDLSNKANSIADTEWRTLSYDEVNTLKQLLHILYDVIDNFFQDKLAPTQKYIFAKEQRSIKQIENTFSNDIKTLANTIKESRSLSKKVEEHTTQWMFSKMWELQVEDIKSISSIISGKSLVLEYVIDIVEDIIGNDNFNKDIIEPVMMNISNTRIKDIIVENVLPILFFNDEEVGFLYNYASSFLLKQVISAVNEHEYSIVFSDSVSVEKGLDTHTIVLNGETVKKLPWLSNQLVLIYIYKTNCINTVNVMQQIEKGFNWLSFLMYYDRKIDEIARNSVFKCDLTEELSEIDRILKSREESYDILSPAYKSHYYELRLKTQLFMEDDNQNEIIKQSIPIELIEHPRFRTYLLLQKIIDGEITFEELLTRKEIEDWLILRYLQRLDREERMVLYKKHSQLLERSPVFFFLNLEDLSKENQLKQDSSLIHYKKQYDCYYEYWRVILSVDPNANDEFLEMCRNDQIRFLNIVSETDIINQLFSMEEFDLAQKYIERLELQIGESLFIRKGKAILKWHNKRNVDALEDFKLLFDDYPTDIFVAHSIIKLSLSLKRKIDEKYKAAAEKSDRPEVLVSVASAYLSEGNHRDASRINLKALLASDSPSNPAFMQYIAIKHLSNQENDSPNNCVQGDTSVFLRNSSDNSTIHYCVYSENVLPISPYNWNGTINLYIDDIAALGLLKKKQGDLVIINGNNYQLETIESVYSYLSRVSFEKILQNGSAKAITLSSENGKLDLDDFISQLKESGFFQEEKTNWLQAYDTITEFPYPLYAIKNFYNCTYSHLVLLVLEDSNLFVRESISKTKKDGNQYILSFSTIILLKKIGISLDFIKKSHSYISESAMVQINEDVNEMLGRYSQEHVSSFNLKNGMPIIYEADTENKSKWLKEAGELKKYVSSIPIITNTRNLLDDSIEDQKLEEIIGMPDYDAIAVACEQNYTLVSIEALTSVLNSFEQFNYNSISVVKWLADNNMDPVSVIRFTSRMIHYGCCYSGIEELIDYLLKATQNANESSLTSIYEAWNNFLFEYESLKGNYKNIAIQYLAMTYVQYSEQSLKETPLLQIVCHALLHLLDVEHVTLKDSNHSKYTLILTDSIKEKNNI